MGSTTPPTHHLVLAETSPLITIRHGYTFNFLGTATRNSHGANVIHADVLTNLLVQARRTVFGAFSRKRNGSFGAL